MFDVVREQAKSKIRENLKFKKAEQDVRFAQLMHKSEIPEPILESHFKTYQEFPTTVENKPTSQPPCTFGTAERFKQPPMQCTQEALHLSALDYNHLVERKRAPDFNGYDKRGDNFLTKEQVADIRLQEEERKQRLARMQMKRQADERENMKSRGKTGADAQTQLTFQYEDHLRVKQMKPYMKQMHRMIWQHYKESVFGQNGFHASIDH